MQNVPWFLHVESFATLIKWSQIGCCWLLVAKLLLLTIVLQRHQSILWFSADLLNIAVECDARLIQLVNIIVECLVPRNSEHTMETIKTLALQSWGALQCWRKQAVGLITCQATLSSLPLQTSNPMLLLTNVKLEKSERIASNSKVGFPGFGVLVCWSCTSGLPSVCSLCCARQWQASNGWGCNTAEPKWHFGPAKSASSALTLAILLFSFIAPKFSASSSGVAQWHLFDWFVSCRSVHQSNCFIPCFLRTLNPTKWFLSSQKICEGCFCY